jgi:hypothetical protein
LVEVLGAAVCFVATGALFYGLTRKKALLLGLLLALGVWTKLSMAFWIAPLIVAAVLARRQTGIRTAIYTGVLYLLALGALLVRNWISYQDVTGYDTFHDLYPITPPLASPGDIVTALQDLFRHFWFIWWKGSEVQSNFVVELFYAVFALMAAISLFALVKLILAAIRGGKIDVRGQTVLFYLSAVGVYGFATLGSFWRGMVPVLQGRFLAPAMVACVLTFAYGLWLHRHGVWMLRLTAALLFAADALVLWGNLLPYHYYWSPAAGLSAVDRSAVDTAQRFFANLVADKPPLLATLLPMLCVAYLAVLAWTWYLVLQPTEITTTNEVASAAG